MEYTDLRLIMADDLESDDVLLTASLVGAPNASDQFMLPKDLPRTVEILQNNCDFHISGIITNEQGGEATVNGWLQAAVLGLPVVDAPCNGRAHPTGVMGSMNLHKLPDYKTVQACVGGNPDTGNHIECFFEGTIDSTSKMVRLASIEAGGLVAVARNPVTVAYAKENCAIGGVSYAIETGKAFLKGLETSVEEGVKQVCRYLNGRILSRGPVENFSIETTGGFDVGYGTVDGCELTFWNEYATAEKDGERLATFPDLIMTIKPPTLASNMQFTLCSFARRISSAPFSAIRALLEVAKCLPLSIACFANVYAGSTPPMASTTMATSGSFWMTA